MSLYTEILIELYFILHILLLFLQIVVQVDGLLDVVLWGCRGIEENVNRTYWTAHWGSEVDLQKQGERFKVISWCWESQRWVKIGASCGHWEQRKKDTWEVKNYEKGKDFKILGRNKAGSWQIIQEGA